MEMQISAYVNDVVVVEIEDKPGSLSRLLKPLKEAMVHVVHMYAFNGLLSGKAIMIFRFSDNDKAIEILQENGIKLMDSEAFGVLETET